MLPAAAEESSSSPAPISLERRVLLGCCVTLVLAVAAAVLMGGTSPTLIGLAAVAFLAMLWVILGKHPPRARLGKWRIG
jgi:uncharacterized membrane protein YgaE (UPF0421/DUF939 family)